MAGIKRPRESTDGATGDSSTAGHQSTSPYMSMFEHFRQELDEHHDRRERVIKGSRDITALSKKIVPRLNEKVPTSVAKDVARRKEEISALFGSIAPDLIGINAWRYQRQISGAIQEYVEALSFEHYLTVQALVTPDGVARSITSGVQLTADDYVLGIFDLVGEMMRFAITQIATLGYLPGRQGPQAPGEPPSNPADTGPDNAGRDILGDLRSLRSAFESLNTKTLGGAYGLAKDIEKKMEVMKTSVEKVEMAAYGVILRGRERPKGWVPPLADEPMSGGGAMEMVVGYD